MNIVDLGPAAQRLADLVARVGDDELGKPTPCPAYTLGDLIEHVGGLALAFTAAANKERSQYVEQNRPGDAARLGGDWRERIPRDLAALGQAWREPGAGSGMTRIAGGGSPAGVVGLVAADELAGRGGAVARGAGPCTPWIFPVSLPRPVRELSASLARLRSSASRNLRRASSSGLASPFRPPPSLEFVPASGSSGSDAVSAMSASCRLAGTSTASHTRYRRAVSRPGVAQPPDPAVRRV